MRREPFMFWNWVRLILENWRYITTRSSITGYYTQHRNDWAEHKLERQLTKDVYPKKYAHGFVVLCFVVVMQSFIMNSHEVFIHIHQGCFAGTGAIVRLLQCQWSKPDGYGKISQSITTTKHSKAKTVCMFLGIYCTSHGIFGRKWKIVLQIYHNDSTVHITLKQCARLMDFGRFCSRIECA